MQKLVPNTLPNQLTSQTAVANNQGKCLEPLEPVYSQYFTSKVKLIIKNEKSHYITILALSQICHYIATHCHKNIATCSNASQLLAPTSKNQLSLFNCQIESKNSPINKTKLHDEYNCTNTSHFSSALSSATVPPPPVL